VSPPLLAIRDLEVAYGETLALQGVSLDVPDGEVTAVLGANGGGKTTLLRAVSGLLRPRRGTVLFDGERIEGAAPHRIVERGIRHVPEGRGMLGELTVDENLTLGAYVRGGSTAREDLERVFSLFPVLYTRRSQLALALSGGEQQMLAIARALMGRPRLLLIDEMSMGLAPRLVGELFRLLKQIHNEGTTLLIVEQNAHQVLKLAARVHILANGRLVFSGDVAELRAREELVAAYLGRD
jgi:branched-chain amino acid transport system ATP-binding protein